MCWQYVDIRVPVVVSAPPTKTTNLDVDVVSDDTIMDVEKTKKEATEVDDARRTSSNIQMLRQVRFLKFALA